MYLIYSNGGKYCSVGETIRISSTETTVKATYLGKVLDKERGIYQNKKRGIFRFDLESGRYLEAPSDFDMEPEEDKRYKRKSILDFGDTFFLYDYLVRSGMSEVLDTLPVKRDALYALFIFYSLNTDEANDKALEWLIGNVAKVLFPKANLSSPSVSHILSRIGDDEVLKDFQIRWIEYVLTHICPDTNVLIDSTGLPNSIKTYLTQLSAKNGQYVEEIRVTYVVQAKTGIPLYLGIDSGNIHDCNILPTILLHLKNSGLDISSATADCGYNTKANLDLFYDENHVCQVDFVTRVKNDNPELREAIKEMPDLRDPENFVQYGERFLFIKKKKVLVGSGKNQPAFLYAGLDLSREKDEQDKAFKRAIKKGLSKKEVLETLQAGGYFGLLSSKEYSIEEILPIYYTRQISEQTFDVSKNYTKLLPLRNHSLKTIKGHILMTYIDTALKIILVDHLKKTPNTLGHIMMALRNQKCTVYQNQVVIEPPQTKGREMFREFNTPILTHLPLVDGRMIYLPEGSLPKEKKKRGRPKKEKEVQTEPVEKKSRGRHKGSKNKKTCEKEELEKEKQEKERQEKEELEVKDKPKRGRRKGSTNLTPEERAAREAAKAKKPDGRSRKETADKSNSQKAASVAKAGKTAQPKKKTRNVSQWDQAEKIRQAFIAAEEERLKNQKQLRKPRSSKS